MLHAIGCNFSIGTGRFIIFGVKIEETYRRKNCESLGKLTLFLSAVPINLKVALARLIGPIDFFQTFRIYLVQYLD